ncbi:MAG: PPC domain-containing DNA-binding protein [Anaerolineales bacterium]
MEVMPYTGPTKLMTMGFEPGEMLLESLQKAIQSSGIQNGAVVSGIGTLKTCRMHYIQHMGFPPQDRIMTLNKPLELLSVNGLIADSEPHLHIVVSCGQDEVYGGHLEEGCEVLYLAEMAILVFNEHRMKRLLDKERNIKLLKRMEL